nr:methyltransferase domain-containing protein [Candidatus Sigynarchaeota archaeon]
MADERESRDNYFDKDEYFVGNKSNYQSLPGGYRFLRRGMFWKGKIKRIARYMPSGKVLDIGCAYGFLLYFMKDKYEVHGCDISSNAVATCKKIFPKAAGDQ